MNDVKNVAEIHPSEPTEQSMVTPLGWFQILNVQLQLLLITFTQSMRVSQKVLSLTYVQKR